MKRLAHLSALLLTLAALTIPAAALSAPSEISDLCNDQAWEVLALANEQRIANGLTPISTFPTLQQIANLRADELVEHYGHDRPDGTSCFTALEEFGLSSNAYSGENIAAGQKSPDAVVTAWMNSEGHRANILSTNYIHGAMGYTYDTSDKYSHHWVQFFTTVRACQITSIRVLPGANGLTIPTGGTIDDLDAAVELTCSSHGLCYLPLISEMCTTDGTTVTVHYGGLSCQLSVTQEIDPTVPFTVSDDYFTAEVLGGEATITKFYDPYMYWGITYIRLPDTIGGYPVTGIADGVFSGLDLGEVYLPSTMTEISDGAFRETRFSTMHIPDTVTRIGDSAFSKAVFHTLTLPNSVTAIGDNAFHCAQFNSIELSDNLESIGHRAFYQSNLTEFPDLPNLRSVGSNAFSQTQITGTVHIPASLTDITPYAFSYMYGVSAFEVDEDNSTYASQDGVLYIRDTYDPDVLRTLYNYPIANTRTEYTVPDTVQVLYCTSFAGVTNLDNLYVPSPKVNCMSYTFYGIDFKIWCAGCSTLYSQLSSNDFDVDLMLSCQTSASENRISFTMSYKFQESYFLLASYDADGRMIDIQHVETIHDGRTPYGQVTYQVPGTTQTAMVRLFQIDSDTGAPTGASMTLWEA